MLFLLFELDNDLFAFDTAEIVEVLPLVDITPVPRSPDSVTGLFTYRGAPVPAIDLSVLILGRPARRRLSTRLLLINYRDGHGDMRPLGLIAEQAADTMRAERDDFVASGIGNDAAPYLGPVMVHPRGLVQWIATATLLPSALRDRLFPEPVPG